MPKKGLREYFMLPRIVSVSLHSDAASYPGTGVTDPGLLVPWHLIFVIRRFGACFVSPFWGVQVCGGAQIFGYLCTPVLEERDLELSEDSNRLILWNDPLPEDTFIHIR
jgi:hypothetical protein